MLPSNGFLRGYTADTPAPGDDSAKVATTAFVAAAMAEGVAGPGNRTVLRRVVSSATQAQLTTDGATQAVGNVLIVPADTSRAFRLTGVARQTGGSAGTVGDSAYFEVAFGGVKRVGGTMTLSHALRWATSFANAAAGSGFVPLASGTQDAAAQAWRLQLDVDGATGQLIVRFTGEADKTIAAVVAIEWLDVPVP